MAARLQIVPPAQLPVPERKASDKISEEHLSRPCSKAAPAQEGGEVFKQLAVDSDEI